MLKTSIQSETAKPLYQSLQSGSDEMSVAYKGNGMPKTRYPPQAGAPRPKPRPKKLKNIERVPRPRPQRYMRLFLEQEGLCFYCRQPMQLPDNGNITPPLPDDRITFEHLFCANDERHTRSFIVAACHKCNQERGSTHHWRDFLISKIESHWSPE